MKVYEVPRSQIAIYLGYERGNKKEYPQSDYNAS